MRSPITAARRRRGSLGFTLIEVLVVMGILALLIGSVITGLGASKQAQVARVTNQLANTIRFAYNKARVTGTYYRLLIDIDKNSFTMQRGDDRMYLPATDRYGRIVMVDPGKVKEREERDKRAEENYNRSLQARVLDAVKGAPVGKPGQTMGPLGQPMANVSQGPGTPGQPTKAGTPAAPGQPAAAGAAKPSTPASAGSLDKYITPPKKVPRRKPPIFGAFEDDNSLSELRKPFKFPPEVKVIAVRTAEDLKPITKGEASLFFFPQGHTQQAHIHVQEVANPENEFTIIVKPLTGRVEIKEGHVDLALPDDPTTIRDDLGKRMNRRAF
ncbi:pilus assembly FimT family protein [Nannocystis bainbridge]|uniref:Prepilin-type N-terminal cleavage/methylation domain-containing protein n=1 Tax=Nannocystis bainbridge TaxID=2995303 RepID=A0ABT5E0E1_9BACT|nr:prepilin-type N-terminal cleavage/methylation domain-containing protein [Nannocystis bainbridge]MDC0719271.1 prepilin-type N-terminal cleavage/methylation domain-containing protein [Nannocystis bainbridge]